MEYGYERRLELSVHLALSDANERIKELDGKDRYAVQQEFLDWMVMDTDDFEVEWFPHYEGWGVI